MYMVVFVISLYIDEKMNEGGLEMCFTPYENTQRVSPSHSPIDSEVVIDTFETYQWLPRNALRLRPEHINDRVGTCWDHVENLSRE